MSETSPSGRLTAIEPQKKRPSRVSVFIDESFAFGLDREVLEKFQLRVGDFIESETIQKILNDEEFKGACSRAFRFLASRPRSRQEVIKRLTEFQYPETVVHRAIERCEKLGYIDDSIFAKQYADAMIRQKSVGRRWLQERLRQLGVSEPTRDAAISEAYAQVDEQNLARKLAEKRSARLKNLPVPQAKARLAAFLQRKGFSWEVINAALARFFPQS